VKGEIVMDVEITVFYAVITTFIGYAGCFIWHLVRATRKKSFSEFFLNLFFGFFLLLICFVAMNEANNHLEFYQWILLIIGVPATIYVIPFQYIKIVKTMDAEDNSGEQRDDSSADK
jgi:hypothetical protein